MRQLMHCPFSFELLRNKGKLSPLPLFYICMGLFPVAASAASLVASANVG